MVVFSCLEIGLIHEFSAKIHAWKTTKTANISRADRAFIASLYDMPNRDTGRSARKQKHFILQTDAQSGQDIPAPFAIQSENAPYKHVLDGPSNQPAIYGKQLLLVKRRLVYVLHGSI